MKYRLIKELLTDKRLSVPQLAEKIGMTKRGLYAAIDNNTISVSTLEKIAEALEVPITVFFDSSSSDELQKNELELSKKLNLTLENNYSDLKLLYENLKEVHELNKKIAESSSKEATAYHNLISMFYEEFVFLLMDYSLYVAVSIYEEHPEIKENDNGELLTKYLNENKQLKKLIQLRDKIEPVVDKKVLERIEVAKNEIKKSHPFTEMFTQSSQKD